MALERIDSNGLSIAYRKIGAGPSVVLLHGGVSDSRVWTRHMAELSTDFTVAAWDAPGCGQSADPPDGFRLPDYADCLAGLMTALDLGKPHVVGHSFGGGLAIQLHQRHPALPRSLTLVGAYAGWKGSLEPAEVRRRLDGIMAALESDPDDLAAGMMSTLLSDSAPSELRAEVESMISGFHPAGAKTMAVAFAEADLRSALSQIDVPTLVIHGEADVRAPMNVATSLRDAIPGAEMVVIPEVGHESYLQAPKIFIRHLRRFFEET